MSMDNSYYTYILKVKEFDFKSRKKNSFDFST